MEYDFKNKNVLITGCNRGIGKQTLVDLAKSGANIWACTRDKNADFDKFISDLEKDNFGWIKKVYFDMSDFSQIKKALSEILKEKIPIDYLINNAAVAHSGTIITTSIDKLSEVFNINVFSQVLIIKLVAKSMIRNKRGSIINITSIGGIETNPGYLAYGSSKATMIWLTKAIANELAPFGIKVNAVSPGLIDTSMGKIKTEDQMSEVINKTAMSRLGEPKEISDAILFLMSNNSSFITGHILKVDGGRL